jgi:hypothetical protein
MLKKRLSHIFSTLLKPFKTPTTLIQTYAIGAEHVSFSKPFFFETNKLECFVPDLFLGLRVKLGGCSQNWYTLRQTLKETLSRQTSSSLFFLFLGSYIKFESTTPTRYICLQPTALFHSLVVSPTGCLINHEFQQLIVSSTGFSSTRHFNNLTFHQLVFHPQEFLYWL